MRVVKNRGGDEARDGSSGSKLKGGTTYMFDAYQVCLSMYVYKSK